MAIERTSGDALCPCGSGKRAEYCCSGPEGGKSASPRPIAAETLDALQTAIEHHKAGRLAQAEALYREALRRAPNHSDALHLLGLLAAQTGRYEVAVDLINQAINAKPSEQIYYNSLGNALRSQGKLYEAAASYRKALALRSDAAETHYNLGNALHELGQLNDAVANFRQALQIKPDYADAHLNLGNALQDLGQLNEAVASYRQALQIKSDFADGHVNLGNVLQDLGKLKEAEASYRRALEIKPDFAEAHSNLGNILCDLGKLDDARASYRLAVAIKPYLAEAHSSLLFLMAYRGSGSPWDYLLEAEQWETRTLPSSTLRSARQRDFRRATLANRRLRVGYVSGDFRQHPVSYFLEQLFAHHDRTRIELFAYPTSAMRDQVSEKLQSLSDHWHSLVEQSDEVVLQQIERDQIDVLIDLSGHTMYNRLGVFARRAAPVQAHYLGYFASTGLTEMDYWIGDEILVPAGTETQFIEQVWRLPRVWMSYDGKADVPVPAWRPNENGVVWVGSFNNLGKLTPATFALWAKVLHALPEGKLLLKTKDLADAGNRQRVLDAMSEHGIFLNRVELLDSHATPAWSAHMACYDRLDVALDPVGGAAGATTSCDALWMGVPVITLEGDRSASRMTASLLDSIGRPEWIARSEDEYIDKVVALARSGERRRALRSSQRSHMAASPLCDARGLAMFLEAAYFEMFRRWFDKKGQP